MTHTLSPCALYTYVIGLVREATVRSPLKFPKPQPCIIHAQRCLLSSV